MNTIFRKKVGANMYERGMTLAEILVVVAIVALLSVSIASFQKNVITYNSTTSASLSSAQDARTMIRTIAKELRSASIGNNGSYPLAQAGTSSITFFADTNADGLKEQIRYFTSGSKLYRGSITPSGSPLTYSTSSESLTVLVRDVRNTASSTGYTPLFEYFDGTYAGTSTALIQPVTVTAVRLVKVNIVVDADPNQSPVPRTYTTQVTLRNVKDNL